MPGLGNGLLGALTGGVSSLGGEQVPNTNSGFTISYREAFFETPPLFPTRRRKKKVSPPHVGDLIILDDIECIVVEAGIEQIIVSPVGVNQQYCFLRRMIKDRWKAKEAVHA